MPDERAKAAEQRLKAAQDRKRRKAMGPPLGLSDAALEQAAAVTEADEVTAGRLWDRLAPRSARGLLDAEAEG